MVDQIKNKVTNADINGSRSNINKASMEAAKVKVQQVTSSSSKPKKTDSEVSKFISKERIKEMAKEPPIDKISTTRIKNAIANGSYPLDLDKIADALYDAYKELKD